MATVFDAWVVAAAVLLTHGGSMHYRSITKAVKDSKLTKLENKVSRGASKPATEGRFKTSQ